MAEALFITTADLKKFTSMNGNVDADKFTQYIKIAQDIHIQAKLGTDLFDKINDDIVASTLTGNYATLVSNYIKPMLIHYAMVEYLKVGAYSVSNKGIYKHTTETSTTVDKNEVDAMVDAERDIAEHYSQRFIDFICNNSSDYPEYNTNSDGDMHPERQNNFTGWYGI